MTLSAKKLGNGQDVLLSAELFNESQYINCYVMCDEIGKSTVSFVSQCVILTLKIAGTMRYAKLQPSLPDSLFPAKITLQPSDVGQKLIEAQANASRIRATSAARTIAPSNNIDDQDEFTDDDINDGDMIEAGIPHHVII